MGDMFFGRLSSLSSSFPFSKKFFFEFQKNYPRTFNIKIIIPQKLNPKKHLSLGISSPPNNLQPTTRGHGCLVPKASPFVALPRDDLRRRSPLRGARHTWMWGEDGNDEGMKIMDKNEGMM